MAGQLGLEKTPEEYIERMVAVFRHVWRVLRDDGTCFLNLGDSYWGSGKGLYGDGLSHGTEGAKQRTNAGSVGVPRVVSCGTSGKEPGDYQYHGCLCENLCDVCRVAYQNHRFRSDDVLVAMLSASLSLPIPEHKESATDHPPTWDFSLLENHILTATQDFGRFLGLSAEQLRVSLESMKDEFLLQLLVECWQRGRSEACLLCTRSLAFGVVEYGRKKVCNCDTGQNGHPSGHHKSDIVSLRKAYPHYTITSPASQALKPKDLCMMPARLAIALQADGCADLKAVQTIDRVRKEILDTYDGEAIPDKVINVLGRLDKEYREAKGNSWYLRSDIIWAKPNPMPESVTDRPTKSHEHLFLLTKKPKYFYDADAVREDMSPNTHSRGVNGKPAMTMNKTTTAGSGIKNNASFQAAMCDLPKGTKRNKRDVWTIPTQSFPEAHFATFPEKLVEPCIKAGTSEKGCCPECGSPWVRVTEKVGPEIKRDKTYEGKHAGQDNQSSHKRIQMLTKAGREAGLPHDNTVVPTKTIGWKPTCECANCTICGMVWAKNHGCCECEGCDLETPKPIPCTVYDPFGGAMTTCLVAYKLNRHYIATELNQEYIDMGRKRLAAEKDKYSLLE